LRQFTRSVCGRRCLLKENGHGMSTDIIVIAAVVVVVVVVV
jgi:hypothetical protein